MRNEQEKVEEGPEDQEGLADGMFSADAYEAPPPPAPKNSFLPWHRPRKQYVRDQQWKSQIEQLLGDLQLDDRPLRYLGLPGVDLLDLRFFHNTICEPKQVRLQFLGFIRDANPKSSTHVELNISLDEVKKLSFIADDRSNVIPDDFKLIAKQTSKAWKETHKLGPYDIVNLDLCDGFAMEEPGKLDVDHYSAMANLLGLQARNKDPWLLFLTSRVGKDHIHDSTLKSLLDKYQQNLSDYPGFKEDSREHFGVGDIQGLMSAIKTEKGLTDIFLTSLCKWLLSNVLQQSPPAKVELKSAIGYRVANSGGNEDLVSLALKFTPVCHPARDMLGLAAHHGITMPSEGELAQRVLRRVAKRKNADTELAGNSALHQEMADGMAQLLELARYDIRAFHSWVADGCPV